MHEFVSFYLSNVLYINKILMSVAQKHPTSYLTLFGEVKESKIEDMIPSIS